MKRKCKLIGSNFDGSRSVYIDCKTENKILSFIYSDEARLKKFNHIIKIILDNLRIPELYDKEDINHKAKGVTAMKMFKGGPNIRIYCKEVKSLSGNFIVVVAELLPKKKNQNIKAEEKNLILKVANYEYEIK